MKVKLVQGAICACIVTLTLYGLAQLDFLQRPPTQAELEEARIFNSDDAQWFGEDPDFGISVKLENIAEDASFAVVTVAGQRKKVAVGATLLPPCLLLTEVLADAVVLDQCGSYSLLRSGKEVLITLPTDVDVDPQSKSTSPKIVDMRGNNDVVALVAEYRQKLYNKPLSLRGQLEVDVRKDNRGLRRYFISPGKDMRLFTALPLQAGDQVVAINGTPMAGKESISDIYGQLNEADNLTVTLLRGRRELVVLLGF